MEGASRLYSTILLISGLKRTYLGNVKRHVDLTALAVFDKYNVLCKKIIIWMTKLWFPNFGLISSVGVKPV